MVENQNSEVVNRMSEELKEGNIAALPKNVQPNIQPVLISNPVRSCDVMNDANNSTTSDVVIFTTPSNKDFYLVAVWLSVDKDVLNDSTFTFIETSLGGEVESLISLAHIPLVATHKEIALSYPTPIKIDRGVPITMKGSFAAGAQRKSGGIVGYTVDTLYKK